MTNWEVIKNKLELILASNDMNASRQLAGECLYLFNNLEADTYVSKSPFKSIDRSAICKLTIEECTKRGYPPVQILLTDSFENQAPILETFFLQLPPAETKLEIRTSIANHFDVDVCFAEMNARERSDNEEKTW